MIVYIIIGLVIVHALYKERQALGCRTIPNGTDCDNGNGKVVQGTYPQKTDTPQELCSKIEKSLRAHDRFVVWRLALLIAFVAGIAIWFACFQKFPSESQLLITLFVISSLIYFSYGFYHFHMWRYVNKNAELSLKYLTSKDT